MTFGARRGEQLSDDDDSFDESACAYGDEEDSFDESACSSVSSSCHDNKGASAKLVANNHNRSEKIDRGIIVAGSQEHKVNNSLFQHSNVKDLTSRPQTNHKFMNVGRESIDNGARSSNNSKKIPSVIRNVVKDNDNDTKIPENIDDEALSTDKKKDKRPDSEVDADVNNVDEAYQAKMKILLGDEKKENTDNDADDDNGDKGSTSWERNESVSKSNNNEEAYQAKKENRRTDTNDNEDDTDDAYLAKIKALLGTGKTTGKDTAAVTVAVDDDDDDKSSNGEDAYQAKLKALFAGNGNNQTFTSNNENNPEEAYRAKMKSLFGAEKGEKKENIDYDVDDDNDDKSSMSGVGNESDEGNGEEAYYQAKINVLRGKKNRQKGTNNTKDFFLGAENNPDNDADDDDDENNNSEVSNGNVKEGRHEEAHRAKRSILFDDSYRIKIQGMIDRNRDENVDIYAEKDNNYENKQSTTNINENNAEEAYQAKMKEMLDAEKKGKKNRKKGNNNNENNLLGAEKNLDNDTDEYDDKNSMDEVSNGNVNEDNSEEAYQAKRNELFDDSYRNKLQGIVNRSLPNNADEGNGYGKNQTIENDSEEAYRAKMKALFGGEKKENIANDVDDDNDDKSSMSWVSNEGIDKSNGEEAYLSKINALRESKNREEGANNNDENLLNAGNDSDDRGSMDNNGNVNKVTPLITGTEERYNYADTTTNDDNDEEGYQAKMKTLLEGGNKQDHGSSDFNGDNSDRSIISEVSNETGAASAQGFQAETKASLDTKTDAEESYQAKMKELLDTDNYTDTVIHNDDGGYQAKMKALLDNAEEKGSSQASMGAGASFKDQLKSIETKPKRAISNDNGGGISIVSNVPKSIFRSSNQTQKSPIWGSKNSDDNGSVFSSFSSRVSQRRANSWVHSTAKNRNDMRMKLPSANRFRWIEGASLDAKKVNEQKPTTDKIIRKAGSECDSNISKSRKTTDGLDPPTAHINLEKRENIEAETDSEAKTNSVTIPDKKEEAKVQEKKVEEDGMENSSISRADEESSNSKDDDKDTALEHKTFAGIYAMIGKKQEETKEESKPDDEIVDVDTIEADESESEAELDKNYRPVTFRTKYPPIPSPTKPRCEEDIIRGNTKQYDKLKVTFTPPKSHIAELIAAITGRSVTRRSNACGTVKVLAAQKKNVVMLPRCTGLLDALVSVISDRIHKDDSDGFNARSRSLSIIFLLSQPRENRRLLCQQDGLLEAIVAIMKTDPGEARMQACSIIATLSKTEENRCLLAGIDSLVTMLSIIVRGIFDEHGVICDMDATNNSFEMKKKRDSKDSNNETLTPARFNSCAALLHLSKQCELSATLSKNPTFLKSISLICLETDSAIHTRCLEMLCNLTKLPSNNSILSHSNNVINALTKSSMSKLKDDRIWSLRAIQNITADISSKSNISTSTIIGNLIKSATNEGPEQEAAIASILNLSTDCDVVMKLMNTKNLVARLLRLAHSSKVPEEIRIMSCDTLATMALRLQSFASVGLEPDDLPVTPLPTLLSTGWLRWS